MSDDIERVSALDYRLPEELIAQRPADSRDASRLLIVDRARAVLRDAMFVDLPDFLSADDLLVLNDTRVVPAKLIARRGTGGRIDGLFVRDQGEKMWEVLLRGRGRLKVGETLELEPGDRGDRIRLVKHEGSGRWSVQLVSEDDTDHVLARVGSTPLPPYIHRSHAPDEVDAEQYQTMFAKKPGAVAAPTAALHFTHEVVRQLDDRKVDRAFVTLHVGPGTFTPISVDALEDHAMHAEWFEMPETTAKAVNACRIGGACVTAVGSTVLRVLESCAGTDGVHAREGWTDLFIRPPYAFQAVDRLLTNFHLPRSTLLALVMAFAGVELTREAYAHAIEHGYRFYSYGDAMLIR